MYDYNPPTLTLKGHSEGNSTPLTLEYVHWPGTSYYVPEIHSALFQNGERACLEASLS